MNCDVLAQQAYDEYLSDCRRDKRKIKRNMEGINMATLKQQVEALTVLVTKMANGNVPSVASTEKNMSGLIPEGIRAKSTNTGTEKKPFTRIDEQGFQAVGDNLFYAFPGKKGGKYFFAGDRESRIILRGALTKALEHMSLLPSDKA